MSSVNELFQNVGFPHVFCVDHIRLSVISSKLWTLDPVPQAVWMDEFVGRSCSWST